jgi:hypothetical protein
LYLASLDLIKVYKDLIGIFMFHSFKKKSSIQKFDFSPLGIVV